jgi:hypothetical protein
MSQTAVGTTAQPGGDLVRPGLYDNSSWEQILVILEEKGFERHADAETVGCSCYEVPRRSRGATDLKGGQ